MEMKNNKSTHFLLGEKAQHKTYAWIQNRFQIRLKKGDDHDVCHQQIACQFTYIQ